jgi:ligand-binding sensor domain-containing protein/AAA+ ATPase superfamily predicted ATPase
VDNDVKTPRRDAAARAWRHRVVASLRWPHVVALVLVLATLVAGQEPQIVPPPQPDLGGTIRGTVLGPGDRPIVGARVTVRGNGIAETVLTAQEGAFEVQVPRLGAYSITAEAPGFRPGRASARIEQSAQVVTPQIRLSQISLRIRVFSDAGGKELPGVSIQLDPQEGGETLNATTDGSGECYFGALKPGKYTIKASLVGYEPYTQEVFIQSPTETNSYSLALSKGSSVPVARSKQRYGTPRLPSDEVQAIFQDALGLIWFGTDRGIARFDGGNFESSATPGSPLAALDGQSVLAIGQVGNTVWIGTAEGLWSFDGSAPRQVPELLGLEVRAIAADAGGDVWVSTASGLYHGVAGHFSRTAQGEFRKIAVDPLDGSLWIAGGFGPGLFHLVENQLAEAAFAAPVGPVTAILRTSPGELLLGGERGVFRVAGGVAEPFAVEGLEGRVTALVEDRRGNFWVATDAGAILYDTRRRATSKEFAGERVNGLANDREGNLWFATEQGAIRRDLYSFVPIRTSDGLINNDVTWIHTEPSGEGTPQLWFVTAGGVQRFRPGGPFELVEPPAPDAKIDFMTRDRAGRRWTCTAEGVFVETAGEVAQASETPAWWLAETSDGQVWTTGPAGVLVFDGETFGPVPELGRVRATRLFDVGSSLWLATDSGAVRFDPATRVIETIDVSHGVQGDSVRWIEPDRQGRIWLATDFGVEILDGRTFEKVEGNAGVNSGSDARALMLDADGFMWVGTAEGTVRKIAFYDGGLVETVFTADQGIPGSLVSAIAQDGNGTIWFATDGGAMQHVPTKTIPTILLRIEVDGRPFDPSGVVPAGQHTIRFLFHGITMHGDVRYLYRLGAEAPWQQLPARQELEREVVYTDLPAGTHPFEIRAINRDLYGIDAAPVQTTLRIDVRVWNKWWFQGLGALAIAGLAIGGGFAYRYKTREYVLPPELEHYVPIEPNPFIVGNPIRHEAMFFGREDDFRYVRTKLEGASQGSVIVLCGERRTGKSSVLYQILNGRLGNRFVPVFIDLQEMVVSSDREFFRRAARLIAEAAGVGREELNAFAMDDERLNPYHQFVDFLDAVLERLGDRTLLLLVDEYELLESKVEEGRLDSEIFLFLAGLMDSKERLSFIFTGSRRLEERDRRYWREMLRRSLFRKIGFLSQNDARRLVTEPVADRVVYGRGVVDRIVRLTAGQPFYTQVICQTAVDYLNENERNALAMRDLNKVVEEIVDHPLPQMIYFWDALSPDEKVVLSLLATRLAEGDGYGWATAGDIVRLVKREKIPVDLSENTIHLTLEELFRTEVLEKNPFEAYRFRIDLLRLWIRRSHSIWQALKEA